MELLVRTVLARMLRALTECVINTVEVSAYLLHATACEVGQLCW